MIDICLCVCVVLLHIDVADEITSLELLLGMLSMFIFGLSNMLCLQEVEDQG